MTGFTIKQLQEKLDVSYPEAFGLINILLKTGGAQKLPSPPRTKDQKGKTAAVYELTPGFGKTLEDVIAEAFKK